MNISKNSLYHGIRSLFIIFMILFGVLSSLGNITFADTSSWVTVGSGLSIGYAEYTSLAFNPATNQPYVVYTDGANPAKVTVMKFNGASWEPVGLTGFSSGTVNYPSLAFNPANNQPYVAYRDNANGGKATVMRFDGFSWVTVGLEGFSVGTAGGITLKFNPVSNEPYVAYGDGANSGKATVMRFDGSSWVTVGLGGIGNGASGIDLAFNPLTNQPYIVYDENYGGMDMADFLKATVMKYDGSQWIAVGSPKFTPGHADWVNLAFNPSTSQPYVAFADSVNSDRAMVMKFDGTSWVYVGSPNFTSGQAGLINLAFNPLTNEPYVVYSDSSLKTSVMKFNGSAWGFVGSSGFSVGQGLYPDIAFNPLTSQPYVAYFDWGNLNKVAVMKFDSVNNTPTDITLSGSTIDENSPIGWMFGGLDTTDQDLGDNFTYSFASGTGSDDNSYFSLTGNTLMTNFVPDYETKNMYSIRVRSTDSGGSTVDKQFSIMINDLNNETGDSGNEVTSITIKSPPTKTGYTPGENLDLSGLEVNLLKQDGYFYSISYGNFSANGITTSKANGDIVNFNDDAFTITVNNLSVSQGIFNKDYTAWANTWSNSPTDNLVIITHGVMGSANDPWVKNMKNNIYSKVSHTGTTVGTFDWKDGAATLPSIAYDNADNDNNAGSLYNQIISLSPAPKHIHLIAHSAGSNVIQTVVKKLDDYYNDHSNNKRPSIHLTFLDAYVYANAENRYGKLYGFSGYAEQYVDMPDLGYTNYNLQNAVNFDITYLTTESNRTHTWPIDFYNNSVINEYYELPISKERNLFMFGFLFSDESINHIDKTSHIGQWCIVTNVSEPYRRCLNDSREEKRDVILTDPNRATTIYIPDDAKKYIVDVSQFIAGGSGVLPKITIESDAGQVSIPDQVTVTSSDSSWNGLITAPEVVDQGPVTINWKFGYAINIGFAGGKLSFNKAVRIVLPKQKGKIATYSRNGGRVTEITQSCSADTQEEGNKLPFDGECKINVGNDLVIRTKHFTTFATYEEIQITSSGGGGGGGGATKDNCPNGDTSYGYYDNKCSDTNTGSGVISINSSTGIILESTGTTFSGTLIKEQSSSGLTFSGTTITLSGTTDSSNTGLLDIITFSDIEDSFAVDDIKLLAKYKIVSGFSDGTFRPNIGITRAEYLKMVLKSLNIDYGDVDTSNLKFLDVEKSSWEANVIAKAIELKIVDGNNQLFNPDSDISRAESMKVLMIAGGFEVEENTVSSFTDVTGWSTKYIEKAKQLGMVNGQQIDGKLIFRPLDSISRGEVAKILVKLIEIKASLK